MDTLQEDRFVLYVRSNDELHDCPQDKEQPWVVCTTYVEARYLQRVVRSFSRDCVIRYLGPTGGGD